MGCFGTGKRRPSRTGASSSAARHIFWSATATTRAPATSTSPARQTRPTSPVAPRGSGVCTDEPGTRRVGPIHAFGSCAATDDVRRMLKMVTHAGDPRAGHGLRANGSRQQWARRARWPAPRGGAQEAEAVDRVPTNGAGGGGHTARASESPAWEAGRSYRAVSPHCGTLPVSTTANIHPPPQHLVTTTMLGAGPLAILEAAGGDLSTMLDANFAEFPFHALR